MKSVVPLLGAGGIFAGSTIAGFALGIAADRQMGGQYWTIAGFFAGALVGAYAALRLLTRSL